MINSPNMPDPELYSRVTNLERFLPLHDYVLDTISNLEQKYAVIKEEGVGLDRGLELNLDLARPTIRLKPQNKNAANLTFCFSTFPSVNVRFGLWETKLFPVCGCDACAETAEDCIEYIDNYINSIISGKFKESIQTYASQRNATRKASFKWSGGGGSENESTISNKLAQDQLGNKQRVDYNWQAWQ